MRLINNPSYTHSKEMKNLFDRYKASIYFKDHSQYTEDLMVVIIYCVEKGKELGLSSTDLNWFTKQVFRQKPDIEMIDFFYLPVLKEFSLRPDLLDEGLESYSDIFELEKYMKDNPARKEYEVIHETDEWKMIMPISMRSSCELGKGTEWCITSTKADNLFLDHVLADHVDEIFFFLIKKDGNSRKNQDDKIAISVINKIPVFGEGDNFSSVDARHNPLTLEKYAEALVPKLASEFLIKIDEKVQELKGKHPAKKEAEEIAMSVEKYIEKIKSIKDEKEKTSFSVNLASLKLSKGMQAYLIDQGNPNILSKMAQNLFLTEESQIKLTEEKFTRGILARNKSITIPVQELLLKLDSKFDLAINENIAEHIQIALAYANDYNVREILARNKNLFESVQLILANDPSEDVRITIKENKNVSQKIKTLME